MDELFADLIDEQPDMIMDYENTIENEIVFEPFYRTQEQYEQLEKDLLELNKRINEYKTTCDEFKAPYTFNLKNFLDRKGLDEFNKSLSSNLIKSQYDNSLDKESFMLKVIRDNKLDRITKLETQLEELKKDLLKFGVFQPIEAYTYILTYRIYTFNESKFFTFIKKLKELSKDIEAYLPSLGLPAIKISDLFQRGLIFSYDSEQFYPIANSFLVDKLANNDDRFYTILDEKQLIIKL